MSESGLAVAAMPARRRVARARSAWSIALDVLVVLALLALSAFFYWRASTGLHYRWDWSTIFSYVVRYDEATGGWLPNILLKGFITTVRLVIASSLIAAVAGVLVALLSVSRLLVLRLIGRSYVELIRNMPSLVFVFIFYFFISSQIMPVLGIDDLARGLAPQTAAGLQWLLGPANRWSNLVAGILCLAMLEAAYVAEIVRAGIESVPRGQREAGRTLGLGRLAVMRHVVLPQALDKVLPPLASQFILLVKASSIMSLISIEELTYAGSEIATSTGRVFEVWLTIAAMYFVLCFALSLLFRRLERRGKSR